MESNKCDKCKKEIKKGDLIFYNYKGKEICEKCWEKHGSK